MVFSIMLLLTSQKRVFSDSIAVHSSKESPKREEKPGPNHGGHIDIRDSPVYHMVTFSVYACSA